MLGRIEGGRRLQQGRRDPPPLISIVIVVFQSRRDLPPLLDSIMRRKNANTELIVVDGGSSDGTLELLQQHDSEIDYWVSEADHGIYDAMNKGIALAYGTFILHLNAGDALLHIPVRELEAARDAGIDGAAFRVLIDGKTEFKPRFGAALRFCNTLHHQGTFFRRESFPTYDTRYKIFADFDVNQRLALRGARVRVFDQVVALHAAGGASDLASRSAIHEFFSLINKNYGWWCVAIAWLICKRRGLIRRLDKMRARVG
jgi:glycosyltransferase involved in cell wall biosynthesis